VTLLVYVFCRRVAWRSVISAYRVAYCLLCANTCARRMNTFFKAPRHEAEDGRKYSTFPGACLSQFSSRCCGSNCGWSARLRGRQTAYSALCRNISAGSPAAGDAARLCALNKGLADAGVRLNLLPVADDAIHQRSPGVIISANVPSTGVCVIIAIFGGAPGIDATADGCVAGTSTAYYLHRFWCMALTQHLYQTWLDAPHSM